MKYLVRSVKYFFYLLIILILVIVALIAFKVVEADITAIFKDGWRSVGNILIMLMVFSAIYPRYGFTSRGCRLAGATDEVEPLVRKVMEAQGYVLTSRDGDDMVFRKKDFVSRTVKMWEDAVTFTRSATGYDVEGLSRHLTRLISAIEAQQEEL